MFVSATFVLRLWVSELNRLLKTLSIVSYTEGNICNLLAFIVRHYFFDGESDGWSKFYFWNPQKSSLNPTKLWKHSPGPCEFFISNGPTQLMASKWTVFSNTLLSSLGIYCDGQNNVQSRFLLPTVHSQSFESSGSTLMDLPLLLMILALERLLCTKLMI